MLASAVDPAEKGGAAHRALVQSLAFSGDGEWLASGGFRKVKIWRRTETSPAVAKQVDQNRGKSATQILSENCTGYSPELYPVQSDLFTFSADKKSLVTADRDKVLRVWNFPDLPPKELKGSAGAFTALSSGPGNLVATAGSDSKIRVWDIKAGKVTKEIPRAGVVRLAFSPDGKSIVSGESSGMLRVWNLATGKQTAELKGTIEDSRRIAELDWLVAGMAVEQSHQKSEIAKIAARNKALDDLLKKAKDNIVAMNKKLPATEKAIQPAKEARIV
ncbi:MAG: hypothetical protein P1V20_09650, partial [Verrucomicrobiales bacterium]|nr:hypothetical protein [Verrucomicrobiales bacterium]